MGVSPIDKELKGTQYTDSSIISIFGHLPKVKKLMGHSDIQTTMVYAHLASDHLANAVDKLPFG